MSATICRAAGIPAGDLRAAALAVLHLPHLDPATTAVRSGLARLLCYGVIDTA